MQVEVSDTWDEVDLTWKYLLPVLSEDFTGSGTMIQHLAWSCKRYTTKDPIRETTTHKPQLDNLDHQAEA